MRKSEGPLSRTQCFPTFSCMVQLMQHAVVGWWTPHALGALYIFGHGERVLEREGVNVFCSEGAPRSASAPPHVLSRCLRLTPCPSTLLAESARGYPSDQETKNKRSLCTKTLMKHAWPGRQGSRCREWHVDAPRVTVRQGLGNVARKGSK